MREIDWILPRLDEVRAICARDLGPDEAMIIKRAGQLLEQVLPERQWRPIDTAPLDGTDVLVYFDCATVPVVHVAFYRSEKEWEESGQYCGGWDTLEEWIGWWSYTTGSVSQERLDGHRAPTHWAPFEAPNAGVQP